MPMIKPLTLKMSGVIIIRRTISTISCCCSGGRSMYSKWLTSTGARAATSRPKERGGRGGKRHDRAGEPPGLVKVALANAGEYGDEGGAERATGDQHEDRLRQLLGGGEGVVGGAGAKLRAYDGDADQTEQTAGQEADENDQRLVR